MLVTFGAVRGAPGVTSLVLELAGRWPAVAGRPALVVDADPDGGCLAARLDLAARPCLTELAGAARLGLSDPDAVWGFAQRARPADGASGLSIVVGPASAEAAQAALRAAAEPMAVALGGLSDHDVLADVGRLRPGSPALAMVARADRRIVVTAPHLESVVALAHRRELLAGLGPWTTVVRGTDGYSAAEIARSLAIEVMAAVPGPSGQRTRRTRRAQGIDAVVRSLVSWRPAPLGAVTA